jgi:hypothetical protein
VVEYSTHKQKILGSNPAICTEVEKNDKKSIRLMTRSHLAPKIQVNKIMFVEKYLQRVLKCQAGRLGWRDLLF